MCVCVNTYTCYRKTAIALPLNKTSSDDFSCYMHVFGAKASLPLTKNIIATSYDSARLLLVLGIHSEIV